MKGHDKVKAGASMSPGSLAHTWVWLSATQLLYMKSVYDIGLICADFTGVLQCVSLAILF